MRAIRRFSATTSVRPTAAFCASSSATPLLRFGASNCSGDSKSGSLRLCNNNNKTSFLVSSTRYYCSSSGTTIAAVQFADAALVDTVKQILRARGGSAVLELVFFELPPDAVIKLGGKVEGLVDFLKYYPDHYQLLKNADVTVVKLSPDSAVAPGASAVPHDSTQIYKDPAKVLVERITEILPPGAEREYVSINKLYNVIYPSLQAKRIVKQKDFENFVLSRTEDFWVTKTGHICRRLRTDAKPPLLPNDGKPLESTDTNSYPRGLIQLWGSANNVPTKEDVYEILKYIPMHWGNFGNLGIPAETKKKHVRTASFLAWCKKQPRAFDMRNIGGTIEIRRAITLHPDAHGLSKEEAERILDEKIMNGTANVTDPLSAQTAAREKVVSSSSISLMHEAILKMCTRIGMGYFLTSAVFLRRTSKKNIDRASMVSCLREHAANLEMMYLEPSELGDARGQGELLIRKKIGIDSARWIEDFKKDIYNSPNKGVLFELMNATCSSWDRTHYLYVRLSDSAKVALNGFDGMVEFLKQHPHVFRVGAYFCKRLDSSDPTAMQDPEPSAEGPPATIPKVQEDNPYHNQRDLALVFHYVTPEEGEASLTRFVECCSPAMRSVLPARMTALVQGFPEFFVCNETSPGVFMVRRAGDGQGAAARAGSAGTTSSVMADDQSGSSGGSSGGEHLNALTKPETLQSIVELVPVRGVDFNQLYMWLKPNVKQGMQSHYRGGLLEVIDAEPNVFHVVKNPPYKTVFLKQR